MFFEYFENLRRKPKDVRKRYAFGISGGLTFLVIIIWLISILLTSFGSRGVDTGGGEDVSSTQEPETTTTLFEKANTFIDDTTGSGALLEEEWTEELENLEQAPQSQSNSSQQQVQ